MVTTWPAPSPRLAARLCKARPALSERPRRSRHQTEAAPPRAAGRRARRGAAAEEEQEDEKGGAGEPPAQRPVPGRRGPACEALRSRQARPCNVTSPGLHRPARPRRKWRPAVSGERGGSGAWCCAVAVGGGRAGPGRELGRRRRPRPQLRRFSPRRCGHGGLGAERAYARRGRRRRSRGKGRRGGEGERRPRRPAGSGGGWCEAPGPAPVLLPLRGWQRGRCGSGRGEAALSLSGWRRAGAAPPLSAVSRSEPIPTVIACRW